MKLKLYALVGVVSFAAATLAIVGASNPPEAQKLSEPIPAVAYDLVVSTNAQNASLSLSAVEAPRIMAYTMLAAYSAYLGAASDIDRDVAAATAGAETAAALYNEKTRAAEMLIIPTRHGAQQHPNAVKYGKEVAARTIALTKTKGYDASLKNWIATPGTTSHPYEVTGRGEPGIEPGWGLNKPIIKSTSECTLPAPSDQLMLEQAQQLLDNYTRTAAVGSDVMWWLAGTGTPTPSGQWLRMGVAALQNANVDGETALRVLTTAAVSAADAGIMGWREKYRHATARPETLWKTLVGDKAPTLPRETPNHPSYPSGHSFFGAAVSTVLIAQLGDIPMTDQLPPDLYVPAEKRAWPSITSALEEAGLSRVHAGFHIPLDIAAGQELGTCVAKKVTIELDNVSKDLQR